MPEAMTRRGRAAKVSAHARGNYVFTPEMVAKVCERHARGEWWDYACTQEGVTRQGLRKARDRDQALDEKCRAAEAAFDQLHINAIAASDDWKAHHLILKKHNPEQWGDEVGAAIPAPAGPTIVIEMSKSEMRERMGRLVRPAVPVVPVLPTGEEGDEDE